MKSAINISLVPETRGGPFVFSDGLSNGFERAAGFGFDAVEIFPPCAEELNARELKQLCDTHGLRIAAIGSGAGWVRHQLRLTDADAGIRRRAQEFIAALIDLAGSFGAPVIVGSIQGRSDGSVSRDQAVAWLAEAFEQLGPRAQARGVPLLYEPLNRYESNLFNCVEETMIFLRGLRTSNVKLLADLFHLSIEEENLPAALKLAGSDLAHVHFADSNRRAVGMGHTIMEPVIAALREIGFAGYLAAEILPVPDADSAAAQTIASFRQLTSAS